MGMSIFKMINGELYVHDPVTGNQVKFYQQSHIADASGGSTVDTEARAAINAVIAALENIGFLASS